MAREGYMIFFGNNHINIKGSTAWRLHQLNGVCNAEPPPRRSDQRPIEDFLHPLFCHKAITAARSVMTSAADRLGLAS
jgi:hypothetical protein